MAGCLTRSPERVVVYCALDREFSEPILDDFTSQTGIATAVKYDVESTKTVGLVNAILQERRRPRCDLFWNNEILHTLRLEKLGLLAPVELPQADKFPANYRSPKGLWYGFAARARVLIINTRVLEDLGMEAPDSVRNLADPRWRGKCAIAKPLFGTTATHAAVLFARWGSPQAEQFFAQVKENAAVLSGNKQVALAVGRGEYAFGLTDTDDAIAEVDNGSPVKIVYPDQGPGEEGTLFIPNTLAVIRGSANGDQSRRLMQYLLTPVVEERLAEGPSAQFPMHADVRKHPRVHQQGVRRLDVDFHAAADAWPRAARVLETQFATD